MFMIRRDTFQYLLALDTEFQNMALIIIVFIYYYIQCIFRKKLAWLLQVNLLYFTDNFYIIYTF